MKEKVTSKTILKDPFDQIQISKILLSSIKDGFVILDFDSNYLYVNEKAAELLGKDSHELIGKHIWTEFPEKEGDLFYDKFQIALTTKKSISFENYFEPWNKWFENRIIPSQDGILIFFHEITDKKLSENKIKAAYNIINKSSSVAVLCKNETNYPVEFISENVITLCGHNYTDFLTKKIYIHEIIHPEDLIYISEGLLNLSSTKNLNNFKPKPFRIVTKNKEIKWVETIFDAIRNEQDEITHIQGIVEDITERKKAEDLFFESNQRLKDQFNNTPLASIMWDLDFKVIEWNNSAQRIFGYSAEEAKGKYAKDLIIPQEINLDIQKIWKSLLAQKGGYRNTNENVTKKGKIITCDWYNVTLKDSQGNITGVASLVNDITESIVSKSLLKKSEKRYRDIFEQSIEAILILKEGVFVDCNESTLKMFGHKNKESLLKIHPSKISPETQPDGKNSFIKAEQMIKIALEKGSNRFRWYHQKKNGLVFPTEVTLTRIDESDAIPTIHAIVKDITERVKKEILEDVLYNISKAALTKSDFKEFNFFVKNQLNKIIDTRNFYIALYNEDTDMISTPFVVDEKEEIKEFPAKKTLTGYVIKSKKPLKVNKESHSKLIEEGLVSLVGTESKIWLGVPLKIQNKVIGAIVVQSYDDENAYDDNDVQLLEFVADQISTTIQRKKIENELKKALEKAQESDKLKSAFLANMSHEIRTPMNGIIGFSELFLNPKLSEIKRNKYAEIVINSSKQLLSIVNDILDISKIEAGVIKLNIESVNINKLLDDLYAFYKPIAQENNLSLHCKKELGNFKSVVRIDKTKLHQVLTNLLSNAFKFTSKGCVEYGYQLIENKLQFYVKDTGVGIDKKLQNEIFDRFTQVNQKLSKKNKGTGLGLSISKKFVELFNGEIWISSNKQGTTIFFTIPYIKPEVISISTVVEEKKQIFQVENKEITILVAEDEEYNMLYINELFSNTKIKIIEANDGKKAVELSQKHPEIDMVLMDIKMPFMNGNEAMEEIKKTRPQLPIIALSAFAMESDKEDALNIGFDSYLTKPIDRKQLFEVIGKYAN